MSRCPTILGWFDPIARMRGDPPQGHVGVCPDAGQESCSQEAQANTTFEISGLIPLYGRVQRAAARPALKLAVRTVEFRYASVPVYQRFSAGGRPAVVQPRCQRPLGRRPNGCRLAAWEGVQLGAAPGVFRLRVPAE
jgi:hypothetical protein